MTFYKIARAESLGTLDGKGDTLRKTAQAKEQGSYYLDGRSKIDVGAMLKRVASKYAISDNPKHYFFEAIRANSSDVFNDNGDGFSKQELLRFDPKEKRAVYMTYKERPHHLNHRTDDPTRARGFIVDAHYNSSASPMSECPSCGTNTSKRANRDKSGTGCKKCGHIVKDDFVEILLAIDTKKDKRFAEAVKNGTLHAGSMGCTCSSTVCNVCEKRAHTTKDFCKHIASHKGALFARRNDKEEWSRVMPIEASRELQKRGRKLPDTDVVKIACDDGYEVRKAAEWCEGVVYEEYSRVHTPADPKALQVDVLHRAASARRPADLDTETRELIAASSVRRKRSKKPRRAAARKVQAMNFTVVRVDGDEMDCHAAPTLEEALDMAMPEEGQIVEYCEVEAPDEQAACLGATGCPSIVATLTLTFMSTTTSLRTAVMISTSTRSFRLLRTILGSKKNQATLTNSMILRLRKTLTILVTVTKKMTSAPKSWASCLRARKTMRSMRFTRRDVLGCLNSQGG